MENTISSDLISLSFKRPCFSADFKKYASDLWEECLISMGVDTGG
jgi:hypothetical protein